MSVSQSVSLSELSRAHTTVQSIARSHVQLWYIVYDYVLKCIDFGPSSLRLTGQYRYLKWTVVKLAKNQFRHFSLTNIRYVSQHSNNSGAIYLKVDWSVLVSQMVSCGSLIAKSVLGTSNIQSLRSKVLQHMYK